MTAGIWVQLGIGIATVLVSSLVTVTGVRSLKRTDRSIELTAAANQLKSAADQLSDAAGRRGEWWKRAQWAMEQMLSTDETRQIAGLLVLDVLMQSDLAGPGETAIGRAVAENLRTGQ